MIVLGKKAMETRKLVMASIGWPVETDPQAAWCDCIRTMLGACGKATYVELAMSIGVSREMLQQDVSRLKIVHPKHNRGWNKATKYGTLRDMCAASGANYQTIYARMRKLIAKGVPQEQAIAIAIGTQALRLPDPRKMSKTARRKYLIMLAKRHGIWRDESKPVVEKKKRGRPAKVKTPRNNDYFTPELTAMLDY